jgi:Uncharacterized conserved protein (DUF2190)
MAKNKVEYYIPAGGFFSFKVNAGETVKIGQLVEIKGDRTVGVATADSQKVVGVVYSGTVGVDGVNDGYKGDNGDVATVVILKPFVFLTAGGNITAGDALKAGANGQAVKLDPATGNFAEKIGMAITGATAGQQFIAVLG